ncbi:MAG: putative lipase [Gammaproteobacteria bacterium]|nr:putative lipase [Gammaproteobacteria bacterium]MCI0590780.1 putative lipase [Gammaproteobacteria bacterium]
MQGVVLVHGVWMNGLDMSLLRHRIRVAGYLTAQFRYLSLNASPVENALCLSEFIKRIDVPELFFVCHSLGGLLVRHLFHIHPQQRPGRIVTLGTPHGGSHSARQLSRSRLGRWLLGRSVEQGLLGKVPRWSATNELGVIAGRLRMGVGCVIPGLACPNDGTVAVEETMLANMRDHITLRVSHTGMLFAPSVARQTLHFLEHGQFDHDRRDS